MSEAACPVARARSVVVAMSIGARVLVMGDGIVVIRDKSVVVVVVAVVLVVVVVVASVVLVVVVILVILLAVVISRMRTTVDQLREVEVDAAAIVVVVVTVKAEVDARQTNDGHEVEQGSESGPSATAAVGTEAIQARSDFVW